MSDRLYLEYSITEWNIPFRSSSSHGPHMKSDKIRPFTIDVAPAVLSDLRQRLKTRGGPIR